MKSHLPNHFIIIALILFFISLSGQSIEQLQQMSISELMQVRVTTVSKTEELVEDAPGIVSVMTRDEIERFGGTTLRDILECIPGLIAMSSDYSSRSIIAIRGDQIKQNSSHVLFLINGRPVREVQEGGVSSEIIETFPIQIIEKIEVVKGPGSVLYGSDAFSGVINLITEKSSEDKVLFEGRREINGGYLISGKSTFKKDDLSLLVAGRYMEKTLWNLDYRTSVPVIGTGTWKDTTYSLSIPDKGPGLYLGAEYKGFSLMSSYNDWTTRYFSSGFTGRVEEKKLFSNLGYALKLNKRWSMDFNTTYTRSSLYGSRVSKRSSYNLIGEWTNHYKINPRSNVVFGVLMNRIEGEETQTIREPHSLMSKGDMDNYSFYAQINYHINDNLNWIGGLQGNKVENRDIHLLPRIGFIWNPLPKWSAKALYSEAYRAPSINELYMNFPRGPQGNPDLDPEMIKTTDLGLTYHGINFQVGADVFYSHFSNIIRADNATYRYLNLEKVDFKGIEIEAKYYLSSSIFMNASMLYQNNESGLMKNISAVPEFGTKAGFSYAGENGILLSLFHIYQGDPDQRFIMRSRTNQGAYHLLNASIRIKLNQLFDLSLSSKMTFICQMDNLLNKSHYSSPLVPYTNDAIPFIPGRRIYTGLSVEF